MAFQNLEDDGWLETDSAGDITRTATRCDVDSMRRDANSWVHRSFGANHFGDLEHDFVARLNASPPGFPGAQSLWTVWAINDVAGTWADLLVSGDGQAAFIYPGTPQFGMRDFGLANTDLWGGIVLAETYYCTLRRYNAGVALQMKIYTDASKTTLKDTLSVVCTAGLLTNLQVCGSQDAGGASAAHEVTGWSDFYDIHEATEPQRLPAYVNARQTSNRSDRDMRTVPVYANDNWTAM